LKCQIIYCRVPIIAGNTFEKKKLGTKEVVEIFTDSDTYLGSKDENGDMEFLDEATNKYREHSRPRTDCNQERKKPEK
jgi:hypothetical protein